jgi:hypothetical protein
VNQIEIYFCTKPAENPQTKVAILRFCNCLAEIKWFGHFFNVEKNSTFQGLFWKNLSKTGNIL